MHITIYYYASHKYNSNNRVKSIWGKKCRYNINMYILYSFKSLLLFITVYIVFEICLYFMSRFIYVIYTKLCNYTGRLEWSALRNGRSRSAILWLLLLLFLNFDRSIYTAFLFSPHGQFHPWNINVYLSLDSSACNQARIVRGDIFKQYLYRLLLFNYYYTKREIKYNPNGTQKQSIFCEK